MPKTLTIRKVPDDIYMGLADLAERNHRSMQEQVRQLLEHDVNLSRLSVCEAAAEYRTKLKGQALGNSVAEIREDRDR